MIQQGSLQFPQFKTCDIFLARPTVCTQQSLVSQAAWTFYSRWKSDYDQSHLSMLLTILLRCVCSPGLFYNYLNVKISVPQNHKPSGLTAQGSFACFTVTRWTLPQFCWISQHSPQGFFNSIYIVGVIHKYSTSNTESSF